MDARLQVPVEITVTVRYANQEAEQHVLNITDIETDTGVKLEVKSDFEFRDGVEIETEKTTLSWVKTNVNPGPRWYDPLFRGETRARINRRRP